jgi:hypothetical protein
MLQREVWLPVRPGLTRVPRVRAVADYIFELFRRERERLSGLSESPDRKAAAFAEIATLNRYELLRRPHLVRDPAADSVEDLRGF